MISRVKKDKYKPTKVNFVLKCKDLNAIIVRMKTTNSILEIGDKNKHSLRTNQHSAVDLQHCLNHLISFVYPEP